MSIATFSGRNHEANILEAFALRPARPKPIKKLDQNIGMNPPSHKKTLAITPIRPKIAPTSVAIARLFLSAHTPNTRPNRPVVRNGTVITMENSMGVYRYAPAGSKKNCERPPG